MKGMKFIQTIRLDGILSYAPGTPEFPLEPLNVLIGPNASGKSNLIQALSLLQAATHDLQAPIRDGGDMSDWIWKGASTLGRATLEVTFDFPLLLSRLKYHLSFVDTISGSNLSQEEIVMPKERDVDQPLYRYRGSEDGPTIYGRAAPEGIWAERESRRVGVTPDQSILSQDLDPEVYPELRQLADLFEQIALYREFPVGRHSPPRLPQKPDLPRDRLLEDASNLGLVLNDMQNWPEVKRQILERLRDFYPSVVDMVTTVRDGSVHVFFHEDGLIESVPPSRLSDGSLRYLCLLAVLCHPNPPWVVCLEEPEVGLHPDVIPEVAKLLVEASSRSQIFVTTHSDILVDALTDVPEAVVVCEKVDGATQLRRLSAEELAPWIENYRLGELWTRGHIGGNRW